MALDKITKNGLTDASTRPVSEGQHRRDDMMTRRHAANEISHDRPLVTISSNREEIAFDQTQPTSFTKGLPHNEYGLAARENYEDFVAAVVTPDPAFSVTPATTKDRGWESPLAGHYFTLQGPDPDAVAIAPAPQLGSSELCAEMAAVYAMALTRDLSFAALAVGTTKIGFRYPAGHRRANECATVQDLVEELRKLAWFDPTAKPAGQLGAKLTAHETQRRAAAWENATKGLTVKSLFRGSTAGAKQGPYVSQFMLLGTRGRMVQGGAQERRPATDGIVTFGAQTVDQRIDRNAPGVNFMTSWPEWLAIQRGETPSAEDVWTGERRFITSPRDMASYVHVDQLYQAYFNACLILLENQAEFDPDFPVSQVRPDEVSGFATFGGPHVLSLMTEVASRALRAVRRQKFQIHRRARPEVMAARLTMSANGAGIVMEPEAETGLQAMLAELGHDDPCDETRPGVLLHWVSELNKRHNDDADPSGYKFSLSQDANYLLPMAFPEGSPMHPAYGAGHATVAGACVTVLKAFFDKDQTMEDALGINALYEPNAEGRGLVPARATRGVTVAEELDKLAANVSLGRNMAGVHYQTDYFDSLRMGERVAVGIIEEQMLTYNEPVKMNFTSFDGDTIEVSTDGGSTTSSVQVLINQGALSYSEWWLRHVVEYDASAIS